MDWTIARKPRPEPWKGIVAGAVGGIGAMLAMRAFHALWTNPRRRWRDDGRDSTTGDESSRAEVPSNEERPTEENEPQAVARSAERLYRGVFGYRLGDLAKSVRGSAVHLGFGTGVGAVYGAIAEFSPKITRGDGVPFGAGLLVVSEEGAVAALGRANSSPHKRASAHIDAILSHAVYGFTLEQIRRIVRDIL